jgi:hypothetical protein
LRDLNVDGSIILKKELKAIECNGIEYIHVAQGKI